jgi:hypothetical protein
MFRSFIQKKRFVKNTRIRFLVVVNRCQIYRLNLIISIHQRYLIIIINEFPFCVIIDDNNFILFPEDNNVSKRMWRKTNHICLLATNVLIFFLSSIISCTCFLSIRRHSVKFSNTAIWKYFSLIWYLFRNFDRKETSILDKGTQNWLRQENKDVSVSFFVWKQMEM